MDTIFRLYTEDVKRTETVELVGRYFTGFTVFDSEGVYKKNRELSTVVEIIGMSNQAHIVRFIAKVLAQQNNQESVLLTISPIRAEFVS
jgi:hypothetical protein